MRWMGLVVAFAMTAGCRDIIRSDEPLELPDAIGYFDDKLFPAIWNELRSCSGLKGNLDGIGFYYVPRRTLGQDPIIRTLALYYPRTHRIFVVESEKSSRDIIRHEMMHALLRDVEGHPPKYFGDNGVCGPV